MTDPHDPNPADPTSPSPADPMGSNQPEPPAGVGAAGPGPGDRIVRADQIGTGAMVAATVLAAVVDADPAQALYLGVCAVLFVAGCGAFAVGFVRAAGRSRTEAIDLAGLFYLTGAAPRPVRRMLLGLWFAQIAVATASVAVTHPPWAVMAPVFGIGILTLWSSRHGSFPPR